LNSELQRACIVILASLKVLKTLKVLDIKTDEQGLRESIKTICIAIANFVIQKQTIPVDDSNVM
jgi:hypothetical protein